MYFRKDEKVFSLGGTSGVILRTDIRSLWSEFFCYLLVSGFYLEGESDQDASVHLWMKSISDERFGFGEGCYNSKIGRLLSRGLRDRFIALRAHYDLKDNERDLLADLDGIFADNAATYSYLSGKKILGVAITRELSQDMITVANYVAVTFGQRDFPSETMLPRLYLSMFGNIHLSKEDSLKVSAPELIFGSRTKRGDKVTALWSFLSSQIDSLAEFYNPGSVVCEMLQTYSFLASTDEWDKVVTMPRASAALYLQSVMNGDKPSLGLNTISITSRFYQHFLYGKIGTIKIIRQPLFTYILNLMVKKKGKDTPLDHIFPYTTIYRRLMESSTIYGKEPRRSAILDYALEALDSDLESADSEKTSSEDEIEEEITTDEVDTSENESDDLVIPEEDPTMDPSTEDGGFDPSMPPPAIPAAAPVMDEDTIDLISFDKTGEGVDEDLYRSAVIALNDRLKSDDSVPVSADVKEALNYWVNGFLYRTAITATKDQIASLGLQQYLKCVSTKG